nr:hypothetical protein [uncultured Rhodopila sp.]
MGTQIVVMDRGWVYVGKVFCEGDMVRIENARNIRRWGTTQGLGELRDGPKPNTQLDPAGTVLTPLRAVIHFIPCSHEW